jgi:hypothetical protein
MWYSTSSGLIELQLTQDDVAMGYHSGSCDESIAALRRAPRIAAQLDAIDPALLRSELKEWGAWSDDDLADHDVNLSRILWLACGDLFDNPSDD